MERLMSNSIHARLDEETKALRDNLKRTHGWSDSEIVRRAIRALATATIKKRPRKFIGEGKYSSGKGDLSTNKKYMEGFGKS
jgi:hypothetical protein